VHIYLPSLHRGRSLVCISTVPRLVSPCLCIVIPKSNPRHAAPPRTRRLLPFLPLYSLGLSFAVFPCSSISNLCVFCAPTSIPTCSVPTPPPFAFVSLYPTPLRLYLTLTHAHARSFPVPPYFTILYCTYGLLVVLGFSLVPHPRPLSRLLLLPHILWIRVGVSNISIGSIGYSLGRC
jgi:hypothetical protein